MALKEKQEAFCQAIVSGMSQADAYRSAYNAEKMKNETIQNNAYKLMQNNEVTTRIQELRGEVQATFKFTREAYLKALLDNIELAKGTGKDNETPQCAAINGSLGLIAKCLGFNEPDKLEVTHKKNIADMTDEELLAYHKLLETKDNE